MIEDTTLILETLGETFTNGNTSIRVVPAHNTNKVGDFHNPFDATNVDYMFYTVESEYQKFLDTGVTLGTTARGNTYEILSVIPDEDGWLMLKTARLTEQLV